MTPTNKYLGRVPVWWGEPQEWGLLIHRDRLAAFLGAGGGGPLTPEQEDRAAQTVVRFLHWPEWVTERTTTLWVADPWLAWVPARPESGGALPLWQPPRTPKGIALTCAQLSVLGLIDRHRSPEQTQLLSAVRAMFEPWRLPEPQGTEWDSRNGRLVVAIKGGSND